MGAIEDLEAGLTRVVEAVCEGKSGHAGVPSVGPTWVRAVGLETDVEDVDLIDIACRVLSNRQTSSRSNLASDDVHDRWTSILRGVTSPKKTIHVAVVQQWRIVDLTTTKLHNHKRLGHVSELINQVELVSWPRERSAVQSFLLQRVVQPTEVDSEISLCSCRQSRSKPSSDVGVNSSSLGIDDLKLVKVECCGKRRPDVFRSTAVITLHLSSRVGVRPDDCYSLHSLHLVDRKEAVVLEEDNTLDSGGVGEFLSFRGCDIFPAEVLVGTAVEETHSEQSLVEASQGLVHTCNGCLVVCE